MSTSINPQPILFLGIDGPLVTNDFGGLGQDNPDTAVFKPEAVQFVNELVRIAGAKIVVISDWAGYCMDDDQYDYSYVPKRLINAFVRNGLVHDRFHAVWSHAALLDYKNKEPDHLLMKSHLANRNHETHWRSWRPHYWLKTQGVHRHYAILDDAPCFHEDILYFRREEDPVLWGRGYRQIDPNTGIAHPDFYPGYVQIDANKGITLTDFDRALHLLIEGIGQ